MHGCFLDGSLQLLVNLIIAFFRELTDEDVRTAIKNSGGIKGSLLIPEAPFELLVRRAIDKLLPPALQVHDAHTASAPEELPKQASVLHCFHVRLRLMCMETNPNCAALYTGCCI